MFVVNGLPLPQPLPLLAFCVWRLCVLMIGDENVALISAIAKKEPAMQRSSAFF
jgi:hypothetical protein